MLVLILTSGQLVRLYAKAASGGIPVDTILIILGLKTLSNLVIILPLAFYLAILISFSRLYRDNEITVLAACGLGQLRLLGPVMRITAVFTIIIGSLSLYIAPWMQGQTRQIVQKSEAKMNIQVVDAGKFRETPGGGGVIYVEKAKEDSDKLQNVFIHQRNKDSSSIISSASGYQRTDDKTGIRYLVLENGYRYDGQPGEGDYVVTQFKQHGIRLTDQELLSSSRAHRELSMLELWKSWKSYDVAEFQWRISTILLCIVLAVLALPLSKTSARQGRYTRLGLALLIYIIYTNLLNASRVWIERGEIPYAIGLWWVHGIMILLAVSFYVQPRFFKSLFSKRQS